MNINAGKIIIRLVTPLVFVLSLTGLSQAKMQLLIQLQEKSGDRVVNELSLYGNNIDPNKSTTNDRFVMKLNGKAVKVPERMMNRLHRQRREYSYDSMTKGIKSTTKKFVCMMAGPAKGYVLRVAYLKYRNHKIVAHPVREVLSEASNCLFVKKVHPASAKSKISAAKAMAQLKTVLEINQ